jgi:hypothetical protein
MVGSPNLTSATGPNPLKRSGLVWNVPTPSHGLGLSARCEWAVTLRRRGG